MTNNESQAAELTDDDVLIRVEDLKKDFVASSGFRAHRREMAVRAVDGISLQVARGETLGVVGETGSGKTTLGRLIVRLLDSTGGRIWFGGVEITTVPIRDLRTLPESMQMVFQDPYGSLNPRMKIRTTIAEPLILREVPEVDARAEVDELLERVGLSRGDGDRYPHEFSGGQRQRIGIARALAGNPALVVLDEPVASLDVSIQAQIVNLLDDLQDEHHLTYVFIGHDLSVVRHISDRIAVMYLGRIVELADRMDLYERPLHPYTTALMSAVPVPDPIKERARGRIVLPGDITQVRTTNEGCPFLPRCYRARALGVGLIGNESVEVEGVRAPRICAELAPALIEPRKAHLVACHFHEQALEPAEAGNGFTMVGEKEPTAGGMT